MEKHLLIGERHRTCVFVNTMPHFKFISVLIAAVFAIAGTASVYAQAGRPSQPGGSAKKNERPVAAATPSAGTGNDGGAVDEGGTVLVQTDLVSIPVRVLDKKGRFIGGLKKENFKVFEDGAEQPIEFFTNEAQPFTVALVLDMSYSSAFKLSEIQTAAIAFIDQLRPADKVIVISFDKEIQILSEATSDRQQIYKAIAQSKIGDGTSLYEAVALALNKRLQSVKGRKAMVLFTDGVDTTSESATELDNRRDALESEILIYPIRYDTYSDVQQIKNSPQSAGIPGSLPRSTPPTLPTSNPMGLPFPVEMIPMASGKGTSREEYARAEAYLEQLAVSTGGRSYLASSFGALTDAFKKIASELREFYSIGYYPADVAAARLRKLKVSVDQPGAVVRSRTDYAVRNKSSVKR